MSYSEELTNNNTDLNSILSTINSLPTMQDLMLAMNPVGTIVMNTTGTNPSEYIGGTWEAWCKGRMPLGLGSVTANSNVGYGSITAGSHNWTVVEETGGEYIHKLSVAEMPAHTHNLTTLPANTSGTDWVGASGTAKMATRATASTGGGGTHNNMPPYQTCYFWKRTA